MKYQKFRALVAPVVGWSPRIYTSGQRRRDHAVTACLFDEEAAARACAAMLREWDRGYEVKVSWRTIDVECAQVGMWVVTERPYAKVVQ